MAASCRYNRKLLATRPAADGQRAWYVLDRQPIIRGTDLRDARVSAGDDGAAGHHVHAEPGRGAALRAIHASAHRQAFRDRAGSSEILSVPVIEDVIRDSGQIRGARTLQEAEDLAVNLRSGALPAAIEVVQERIGGSVAGRRFHPPRPAGGRGRAGGGGRGDAALLPLGGRQRDARAAA